MGRVIVAAIGLTLGIACVVVGIRMTEPPVREGSPETHTIGAVGEAYGMLLGWVVLIFGVLVLCGVLGYLSYAIWRKVASKRRATPPVEPAAELPEARVHGRLPGAKNGK
jgi:hypothetical protein